jgi:hypothetical protein
VETVSYDQLGQQLTKLDPFGKMWHSFSSLLVNFSSIQVGMTAIKYIPQVLIIIDSIYSVGCLWMCTYIFGTSDILIQHIIYS